MAFRFENENSLLEKLNNENCIELSFLVLEILTVEVIHILPHESMSELPY